MTASWIEPHPLLTLDAEAAVQAILDGIRDAARMQLGRRSAIVAVSGGIDSSVTAKLCAMALGSANVTGLLMPERESSAQTRRLSREAAAAAGIRAVVEDITPILEGAGCYRRRDAALRELIPAYGPGWRCKIVQPPVLAEPGKRAFRIVARGPDGEHEDIEPAIELLRAVVAASNFKQRTRKMLEYYYADRLNGLVAGTSNRMEAELGFFVKLGDGAGDLKPIAHLYKSQVYQVGAHIGLPAPLLQAAPTPDTYPLAHDAEEFFFAAPLDILDLCLFCRNNRYSVEATADVTGLTPDQVTAVFADMAGKRAVAEYLHAAPITLGDAG